VNRESPPTEESRVFMKITGIELNRDALEKYRVSDRGA
jgi:hypothetical protein